MTNSNEKGPSPEEAHSAKAATNSHETDTELSSSSSDNQSEQIDPPAETSKTDPDQSICSETEEQLDGALRPGRRVFGSRKVSAAFGCAFVVVTAVDEQSHFSVASIVLAVHECPRRGDGLAREEVGEIDR